MPVHPEPGEPSSLAWSTFAPIDLGARLRPGADTRSIDEVLIAHDWTHRDPEPDELTLLGKGTLIYRAPAAERCQLFLVPTGFAVLQLDGGPFEFSERSLFSAPFELRRRRDRHRALLRCEHDSLPTEDFEGFVADLRRAARKDVPAHLERLHDERTLHYVMTVYFLHGCSPDANAWSDRLTRHVHACLDPGSIGLDDTPFLATDSDRGAEKAESLIDAQSSDRPTLSGAPLADRVTVHASWSSVYAVGEIAESDRRLIAALQVRVQSSWLAAWSIGDLSGRLVEDVRDEEISPRRIEGLAFELGHLKDQADARLDASASERLTRVWQVLIETSGLVDEWKRADLALGHARGYAAFVNSQNNYRFQTAFECLLLVFAVSQLAPILLTLPLDSWSDLSSQLVPILVLLAVMAGGLSLILRRQR